MLTKRGIVLLISSVFLLFIGFWMVDIIHSPWIYRYSSTIRTVFEIFPWFLILLGIGAIIGGIAYIIIDKKPLVIRHAKVIEKNGLLILFEFEDGTRENLAANNDTLIVGDICEITTKSSFVIDCKKIFTKT